MAKKKPSTKGKFTWKAVVIIALWAFTLIGVAAVMSVFLMAKNEKLGPMPSFDELENPKTNLATQIYSADGEVIGTYFIENRGIALSREKILNNVWNYDYFGDARTIDTHVKKLRSKMGEKGDMIKTIWGMGYKLEE